jgi:hypothetical protein
VAIPKEPFLRCLVRPLFLSGLDNLFNQVEAERLAEDALVGVLPHGLAAMLLDHSPSTSSSSEFIVDTIEHQKGNDSNEQNLQ